MWYGLRMSSKVDPDLFSAVTELLQATLRTLILAVGGTCLAWYLVATVTDWWERSLADIFFVSLAVVLAALLALYVLPRRLLAAQVIWLVGLTVATVLAIYLFQQPEVACFFSLLPLVAVITVGWPAGLITEGLLAAVIWFLPSLLTSSDPSSLSLGILAGGAISGMLGWAATRSLLTVTQWSLSSYNQARQKMEEAREHRLERKQVEEDLTQANQELARLSDRLKAMYQVAEEARRAKEAFVANVSHELRTPLNMIVGFSEIITHSPQLYGDHLPPALLSDIAAIHLNSQHLSRLVDDVLDLSQVEAGRMALSKEWVSLPDVVHAAALAVRDLLESKGLYLELDVPSDLPAVFCDSTRIRQVVLNLLSNASRFTEQGGVRIAARRARNDVVISVTDTGPGITPEDQERLFEPFQQLDSSIRRRHGGSGLGLSISKRFVEMHGGKMWLESQVGVGTTFHFSLPLETLLPAALAGVGDALRWFSPYSEYEYRMRTRRSKAEAPVVCPRFVLVEEDKTLERLLTRYLHGFEIVSVTGIDQAILELSRSPAQALIVNAPLNERAPVPGDGVHRMDQLASLPYGTPAVICWVPGEDETARQLGVVRYLVKPVTREMLLSTLEDLGEAVQSVLVVDDQPEALQLFARMLYTADRPYRVLRAENGQRALGLLRQRRPDVMLLDLIMPGMDGFQVLQEKGQDSSIQDIPVIIISSRDPGGEPIVSNVLTVTRGGGLSARDLLACIQAVSEILSPSGSLSVQAGDQAQPGRPVV